MTNLSFLFMQFVEWRNYHLSKITFCNKINLQIKYVLSIVLCHMFTDLTLITFNENEYPLKCYIYMKVMSLSTYKITHDPAVDIHVHFKTDLFALNCFLLSFELACESIPPPPPPPPQETVYMHFSMGYYLLCWVENQWMRIWIFTMTISSLNQVGYGKGMCIVLYGAAIHGRDWHPNDMS